MNEIKKNTNVNIFFDWFPLVFFVSVLFFTFILAYQINDEMTIAIGLGFFILMVSAFSMNSLIGVFNIKKITIPSFWFYTYIIMIFVPSIFIFYKNSSFHNYSYLFAVFSALITIPIGIMIVNFIYGFRRNEIIEYYRRPVEKEDSNYFDIVFIFALLVTICLAIAYMFEVKNIPLLHMIRNPGQRLLLAMLREESFKLLDSPIVYLYFMLRATFFPILIVISLGNFLFYKNAKWLILFSISFVTGIVYASLSIAKWPVAAIFLLMLLFVYLYYRGLLSSRLIAVSPLVILAFPILVVIFVSGSKASFMLVLTSIIKRLFYAPPSILYYYFEVFPEHVNYLYGASIGKFAWLAEKEFFNAPNYVYKYIFNTEISSGHANAPFLGNLNADFGLFGVLIGGVIAGIIMQILQVNIIRSNKTIVNISVYAYLVFAFWMLNSTSLPVVLLSNGVILVLFVPVLFGALNIFTRYVATKYLHKSNI